MMSREDILRELELLPVWQLRNPEPTQTKAISPQAPVDESAGADELANEVETELTHTFRYIVSDDAQWGFVLPQSQSDEAETLLQNMLKAVFVNVAQNIGDAGYDHLNQYPAKVIVVMGEHEIQHLLKVEKTLEQLRDITHQFQDVPVIATFTPEHLLQNLQDKAKAWEDLCLAKLTITNL